MVAIKNYKSTSIRSYSNQYIFSLRNSLSQAIDWESSDDEKHDISRVEQNSQLKISDNSSQERNLSSCKSSKRLNFEDFVKDNNIESKRQKLRVGVTGNHFFGTSSLG